MVEDAIDSGHMADCMSMSPCEIRPCQNGGTCSEIDTSRYSLNKLNINNVLIDLLCTDRDK